MSRFKDAALDRLERMATWYFPYDATPREIARGIMRASFTVAAPLGGAAMLLVIANGEKVVPQADTPSFTVGSSEGDIRCSGTQGAVVTSTVGETVAASTVFVASSNSFVTPDLSPVVSQVIEMNGIVDETKVPNGAVIQVPNFCTFAP